VPVAWEHTTWLQIKQLRIDAPAGTIHPTRQLLVRDAHSAAESVLPCSALAAIYGVMSHVHISNTPSSKNVIVELDGLLQAKASIRKGSSKEGVMIYGGKDLSKKVPFEFRVEKIGVMESDSGYDETDEPRELG